MKRFFPFSLTISILVISAFTNQGSAQNQNNYYSICYQKDAYYNANPSQKVEEDGGYMDYIRWKEFWRTRSYCSDTNSKGLFIPYYSTIESYLQKQNIDGIPKLPSAWQYLGPKNLSSSKMCNGLVSALYIDTVSDKSMNTIFVGTSSSGIWKTTDGGDSWINVTDGSGLLINGITGIVGDPNNGNVLYASTSGGFLGNHSYCTGIIKTADAGLSWSRFDSISPVLGKPCNGLLLDPLYTQRMFVLFDTTVIRTLDGGAHWDTILRIPRYITNIHGETCNTQRFGRNIVMKPGNADYIYVSTDCWGPYPRAQVWEIYNPISNPGLVATTELNLLLPNGGDTIYTQRFNTAVTSIDTNAIYIACVLSDFKTFKMWKYNNGWSKEIDQIADAPAGVGYFKFEFLVSPTDSNVFYVGGLAVDKWVKNPYWTRTESTPSGDWSQNYHDDTRCAKILKGSSPNIHGAADVLFAGNDGGLSRSNNGINSWINLNGTGLNITQFWGIGGSNFVPDYTACGAQDNCFFGYHGGGWYHNDTIYGDFGNIVVDKVNSSPSPYITMYGNRFGSNRTFIAKSNDLGVHWNAPSKDTVRSEPRIVNPVLKLNPQNHKTVFWGAHNLYKSYDRLVTTCIKVNINQANGYFDGISAFDIAPSDSNIIFVAYDLPTWTGQPVKFLRSTNYGSTWDDLTNKVTTQVYGQTIPLLDRYGITDIVISPTDPRKIWISFGGILTPWLDSARVLVSFDAGENWTNVSRGLPALPINCIRYMKGYNDRLFAGTDVGVFYLDNDQTQWQPFNTGLPVCVVNDLEIDDSLKIIYAGTYGRGLWETDLNCLFDEDSPITIHKDTTWNSLRRLDCSVYIDSSFTLTITDTVLFPPLGKICIKPGGTLIVNGGVLSTKCPDMWKGIEVWGRNERPEATYFQGNVILQNGAVVENARIGITTSMKLPNGYIDWSSMGGIIKTDGAIFRNNYKAVEFFGNKYGQASYFRKTIFETTGPFVDGHSTPGDFITMSGTSGVRFEGCTFRNTTVPDTVVPGSTNGRGIFCYNSSFRVDSYIHCRVNYTPCPNGSSDTIRSVFKGLIYGIRAIGAFPIFPITVNETDFLNNYRGIYMSNQTIPSITRNYFSNMFLQKDIAQGDTVYGLYLERSNLYKVQENIFKAPRTFLYMNSGGYGGHSVLYKQFGIIVDNSGTDPNEIYKNVFDTLEVAINAQNLNMSSSGDSTGLVIKCNQFRNNSFDELISRKDQNVIGGIAKKQGAGKDPRLDPAGNLFSPYHVTVSARLPESDIKNRGENLVYWSHKKQIFSSDPRVYPDYVDSTRVFRKAGSYTFDSIQCCPSKLFSGSGNLRLELLFHKAESLLIHL